MVGGTGGASGGPPGKVDSVVREVASQSRGKAACGMLGLEVWQYVDCERQKRCPKNSLAWETVSRQNVTSAGCLLLAT